MGPGCHPAPKAKHIPEVHQVMSGNRKGSPPGAGSLGTGAWASTGLVATTALGTCAQLSARNRACIWNLTAEGGLR